MRTAQRCTQRGTHPTVDGDAHGRRSASRTVLVQLAGRTRDARIGRGGAVVAGFARQLDVGLVCGTVKPFFAVAARGWVGLSGMGLHGARRTHGGLRAAGRAVRTDGALVVGAARERETHTHAAAKRACSLKHRHRHRRRRRDRHRHRHTDTQTHRHRHRHRHTDTDTQNTPTHTHTHRSRHKTHPHT